MANRSDQYHAAICCWDLDELERLKATVCEALSGIPGGVKVVLTKSVTALVRLAQQNSIYLPCIIICNPKERTGHNAFLRSLMETFTPLECICLMNDVRLRPSDGGCRKQRTGRHTLTVIAQGDAAALSAKLMELQGRIPQMLEAHQSLMQEPRNKKETEARSNEI